MFKELKFVFYLTIIFVFIFFIFKHYFSNENKKNSFRSHNSIEDKIFEETKGLLILKNDTNNFLISVENNRKKNNIYNFWDLLNKNVK